MALMEASTLQHCCVCCRITLYPSTTHTSIDAGLWSLDDLQTPETKQILDEVRSNPEQFVLKPQREGGGNNLYGKAILDRLKDTKGLAAFILMQRIRPPIHR